MATPEELVAAAMTGGDTPAPAASVRTNSGESLKTKAASGR